MCPVAKHDKVHDRILRGTELPMIPDDALDLILGGNAARIYGLSATL